LFVFKHESELGNAPAAKLFETVSALLLDETKPPRGFTDYEIRMRRDDMPPGVQLLELL
jgi:CRISPR-associated protein Csd2